MKIKKRHLFIATIISTYFTGVIVNDLLSAKKTTITDQITKIEHAIDQENNLAIQKSAHKKNNPNAVTGIFEVSPPEVSPPTEVSPPMKTPLSMSENNKTKIILGTTLPMSGKRKRIGQDFVQGMNEVFQKKNNPNYSIQLLVFDNQYKKTEVKKNIKTLLKKTSIIFSAFGPDLLNNIALAKKETTSHDYTQPLILFPQQKIKLSTKNEFLQKNIFYLNTVQKNQQNFLAKKFSRAYQDGYTAAKIFINTINNIPQPITKEKLIAKLKNVLPQGRPSTTKA